MSELAVPGVCRCAAVARAASDAEPDESDGDTQRQNDQADLHACSIGNTSLAVWVGSRGSK